MTPSPTLTLDVPADPGASLAPDDVPSGATGTDEAGPLAVAPVPISDWGARVAEARRMRRLSQVRVAQLCGVSQQTISKVEHGEICPHDKLKLRLAAALEVPPSALFPWPLTRA